MHSRLTERLCGAVCCLLFYCRTIASFLASSARVRRRKQTPSRDPLVISRHSRDPFFFFVSTHISLAQSLQLQVPHTSMREERTPALAHSLTHSLVEPLNRDARERGRRERIQVPPNEDTRLTHQNTTATLAARSAPAVRTSLTTTST